jgi:carboxylesterase type B
MILGSKTELSNPSSLIVDSTSGNRGGMVFVSINYRLGLLGWLSAKGVDANIGLMDQRLAMQWVQKYIHLFGGDPTRVTLMGNTASAIHVDLPWC